MTQVEKYIARLVWLGDTSCQAPKPMQRHHDIVSQILLAVIKDKTLKELIESYISGKLLEKADEQTLPKNPIKITPYLGLTKEEANTRQLESDCFVEVIQDQMLKSDKDGNVWVKVKGSK